MNDGYIMKILVVHQWFPKVLISLNEECDGCGIEFIQCTQGIIKFIEAIFFIERHWRQSYPKLQNKDNTGEF